MDEFFEAEDVDRYLLHDFNRSQMFGSLIAPLNQSVLQPLRMEDNNNESLNNKLLNRDEPLPLVENSSEPLVTTQQNTSNKQSLVPPSATGNKNKFINKISAIAKDSPHLNINQTILALATPVANNQTVSREHSVTSKQQFPEEPILNKIPSISGRTVPKNAPSNQSITIGLKHQNTESADGDSQSLDYNKNSDKLEKNRKSAKMSRERKKIYMELLETKVSDLEKQIQKTKEELQSTENYLQKVITQNQTMSGFAIGRQQTMKKLEKLIENEDNVDTNEINMILDSLRNRIGATGRERVNTINEYFKQIVNISFPALHRYMMWTASEQKHLFKEIADPNNPNVPQVEEESWFRELDEKLGLTQEQKKEILARRSQFEDQKNILLDLINQLHETKRKIEIKSEALETEIDKIRSILTPLQAAKFILFIQKNKYRKELNIWDKKRDPPGNLAEAALGILKKPKPS